MFGDERGNICVGGKYSSGDGTHANCLHKGLGKTEVYRENGRIVMDCACSMDGKLAAFCIETEEVVYVDGV